MAGWPEGLSVMGSIPAVIRTSWAIRCEASMAKLRSNNKLERFVLFLIATTSKINKKCKGPLIVNLLLLTH